MKHLKNLILNTSIAFNEIIHLGSLTCAIGVDTLIGLKLNLQPNDNADSEKKETESMGLKITIVHKPTIISIVSNVTLIYILDQ